jgi:hypothetical protein
MLTDKVPPTCEVAALRPECCEEGKLRDPNKDSAMFLDRATLGSSRSWQYVHRDGIQTVDQRVQCSARENVLRRGHLTFDDCDRVPARRCDLAAAPQVRGYVEPSGDNTDGFV